MNIPFFNPNKVPVQEKVIKGGSFHCSATYCASYRPSARISNSVDSSQEHLGYRTVISVELITRYNQKKPLSNNIKKFLIGEYWRNREKTADPGKVTISG